MRGGERQYARITFEESATLVSDAASAMTRVPCHLIRSLLGAVTSCKANAASGQSVTSYMATLVVAVTSGRRAGLSMAHRAMSMSRQRDYVQFLLWVCMNVPGIYPAEEG